MKLALIVTLCFIVTACSDGFNSRDRATIAELQSDVNELKEQLRIANQKSNGCPEKLADKPILHLPPKLYSSEIDKQLSEIEILRQARAVTFYLHHNSENDSPYRVSVLVVDYRGGRLSFDAVNPLVISDFLKKNVGPISIEMPTFLYPNDWYDQEQVLAFKKAMLAVFNDYSNEQERKRIAAEALNESLSPQILNAEELRNYEYLKQ